MRLNKSNFNIYLPFKKTHAGQKKVLACKSRIVVLNCGRCWGKNAFGTWWTTDEMYGGLHHGGIEPKRGWLLAPSKKTAAEMEMQYIPMFRDVIMNPVSGLYRSDYKYHLFGGHVLELRSAEMMGNVGSRLDFLVIDEAALIPDSVYYDKLKPALLGRKGRVLIMSTPNPDNPRNWFYHEYLRGLGRMDEEISSFHFTSYDNTFLTKEEIDNLCEGMSYSSVRTQIYAEFPDDNFGVFRNIKKLMMDDGVNDGFAAVERESIVTCSKCTFKFKPRGALNLCPVCRTENEARVVSHEREISYFIGIDPAKSVDFTVIKVLQYVDDRPYLREVYNERFNDVSYETIKNRICNVFERFQGAIGLIDCSGAGDPMLEDLQNRGLNIEGLHFNNATKTALVENLIQLFDSERIRILPDNVTEYELSAFTMTKTPTGLPKYSAPAGGHDDSVIALGLAAWCAPRMFGNK